MIRRPTRSTRTDTLFPHPTLFRSAVGVGGTCRELSIPQESGSELAHPHVQVSVGGPRRSSDTVELDLPIEVERRVRSGSDELPLGRSEEHTSELQSLMRISYAVFCLKKKKTTNKVTVRTNKS